MEVDGISQRELPRKTWRDGAEEYVNSYCDLRVRKMFGVDGGRSGDDWLTQVYLKMTINLVYVFVSVCVT